VTLLAIDPPPPTRDPFQFSGGRAAMWRALDDGAVIVSEPFSYHRGIAAGDRVELHTDHGVIAVPVAGVVRHYGSSEGVVFMHRRTYERLWNDRGVSSIAVYAEPGVDHEALARAVRIAAGPDEELVVRESARLREDSLRIFDRTFAVTGVLRLLVIVVAFVGVFAALMALELERTRELAVLRAQGFTGRDVARLVVTQTTLMGVIAGIAAIPIGVALAATLVHVINRRAFGWTLDFIVTPEPLVQALVLAVVAALFAGVYPAWRLARGPLASALREE
jgi:putative ABC transport system permease protein